MRTRLQVTLLAIVNVLGLASCGEGKKNSNSDGKDGNTSLTLLLDDLRFVLCSSLARDPGVLGC